MKKKLLLVFVGLIAGVFGAQAQRSCGTMENLERLVKEHPEMLTNLEGIEKQTLEYTDGAGSSKMAATVYNIPVVVHVVYNTSSQNITDAQIQSQIDVLNKDFRRQNTDAVNTPSAFTSVAADVQISFCLATKDPNGNPTSGITRTYTSTTSFDHTDKMKSSSTGGKSPWPTGSYLNIWVCNLSNGLLGYAQFPGGPAATDGVVIGYKYFGTTGTVTAPFNKGRTATHEVGHWLNLRHIWGDATCGSDYVSDTPTQQTSNYGCPSHPHPTCSNNGDMFMNYMDYTDDACMNMFTTGQKSRMRALFATGGYRASLLSSQGCSGSSSTTSVTHTIGTGTSQTATAPYGTYYMDERSQFIITKAELVAAGYTSANSALKALAFNVASASSQTMYNFTIKIRHTTATSFSSTSFYSSSGMTTVFSGSVTAVSGWNTHNFSTAFNYNGTDNILVDICWNNSTYTTDSKVYSTYISAYRSIYKKADVSSGGVCGYTSGSRTYYRPNMKMTFVPASSLMKTDALAEEEITTIEIGNTPEVNIYPNPASTEFTVDYTVEQESANVEIYVYDMMGKMVGRIAQGTLAAGQYSVKVQVESLLAGQQLPAGIYLCTLNIDGNLQTKRFMIQ